MKQDLKEIATHGRALANTDQAPERDMATEQRIAIAKACGWRSISIRDPLMGTFPGMPRTPSNCKPIPNYLNDLNAMHEAWKTLTPSQKEAFESNLYTVIVGLGEYHRNDDQPLITNATAAQRAQAFLMTIDA